MKTKKQVILIDWDDHMDKRHGKKGTPGPNQREQEFEASKLGALMEEARKRLNLTQAQVAEKCRTNKAYISRIENDASDIKLSTLLRIIHQGLGGHLKLTLKV